MQVPAGPGGQPATYLGPALARRSDISSADPAPAFPCVRLTGPDRVVGPDRVLTTPVEVLPA